MFVKIQWTVRIITKRRVEEVHNNEVKIKHCERHASYLLVLPGLFLMLLGHLLDLF